MLDYARLVSDRLQGRLVLFEPDRLPIERGAPLLYVQFSGYGYQKRGVPIGFLQWLRDQRRKGHRIGVFFHELYAFGPPWASSFWLSPLQRYIAAALANLSDFWITNRAASAAWLLKHTGQRPHAVLPTPSVVGEGRLCAGQRDNRLVVFGGAGLRMATYEAGGEELFGWAARRSMRIDDIGPHMPSGSPWPARILAAGGTVHGRLPASEVCRLLSTALVGAATYPLDYAAKSSVIASYCAHGIAPLIYSNAYPPSDGLIAGVNYARGADSDQLSTAGFRQIGDAAFDWYRDHALAAHVERVKRLAAVADQ